MSDRVALFVPNYNMGEAVDRMVDHVERHTCVPHDWYVVDNASDLVEPSIHTNVWIKPNNKQTTAGWLAGLKAAKRSGEEYLGYLFTITSCDFEGLSGDPLEPMVELLQADPNAVGVHAALTPDSTTSWEHLKTRPLPERSSDEPIENIQLFPSGYARRTWFIDNLWAMYRASWFDSIGWFDPDLRYAWGIDLETCFLARQQGRSLWVHEGVHIRKVTDIAYRMERMRMSAEERRHLAGMNMSIVLERKYGPQWRELMYNGLVESEWR